MRTGARFSVFAFISTLVLCIAAISPIARAASVGFDQISWGDGSGGYQAQYSQYGQASVSISPSDVGSLSTLGSGYLGWVNIVASVAGGSNNYWAVENQPVVFTDPSHLGGDLPYTFLFDLTQPDGTPVSSLNYSLSLTPGPLTLQPSGPLTSAGVNSVTKVTGLQSDQNSEGFFFTAPLTIAIGIGVAAAIAAYAYVPPPTNAVPQMPGPGSVQTPTTNLPSVNEADNGCAPGAAARSIRYLGNMIPSLNVTQNAQQIYGSLTNLMMSFTGPASTVGGAIMITTNTNGSVITNRPGTVTTNFVAGKNLYFSTNNLSIAPTTVTTNFGSAISALNSTGDVEIGVSWGYTNVINGVVTQRVYQGGHAVMVTGITPVYTNGVLVQYVVDIVQDPNQGSGSTTNETDRYIFDPNGNLLNRGYTGARLNSLRIEQATVVPEPGSLAMVVLGFGAVGLPLLFIRRPKHSRS